MIRPARQSKTQALRIITGIDEFPDEIADDDVAAVEEESQQLEQVDDGVCESVLSDDTELPASDLEYMDTDNTDSDEDGDQEEELKSLQSPSGLNWKISKESYGRQPLRNICNERAKVRIGIHPNSKLEMYLMLMNNIIKSTILFTNQEGRRIGLNKKLKWKSVSMDEMNAFLGLHI